MLFTDKVLFCVGGVRFGIGLKPTRNRTKTYTEAYLCMGKGALACKYAISYNFSTKTYIKPYHDLCKSAPLTRAKVPFLWVWYN